MQKKEEEAPQTLDLFGLLGTGPAQPAENNQPASDVYNPPDLLGEFMSQPTEVKPAAGAENTFPAGDKSQQQSSMPSMFAFMSMKQPEQ